MAAPGTSGLQNLDIWNGGRNSLRGSRKMGSQRSGRQGSRRNQAVYSRNNSNASSMDEEPPDDEEALKWAALEKLPTYDRVNHTILGQMLGSKVLPQQIDLRTIGSEDKQSLLSRVFAVSSTEDDHEAFLHRLRDRILRVGVQLPTVEIRYENVSVHAEARLANRALPTLYNVARNTIEGWLDTIGIPVAQKVTKTILRDVSGVIRPGRFTLLLGPPASGKTTLLLSLAGRLKKNLETSGVISYNGYKLDEFVPQKTSAYISQHDLHIGEMTVRETFDFSAKCQGVGERYDLLTELVHREKEQGISPESDVDFFMKGTSMKENSCGLVTDYVLRILGLDICADILVGDDMRRGISGGQKKRVTTGEMIAGPMKTLFMDEISTGLDSSTTYQIIKCLGDICRVFNNTMLVSLLQPAPETYNLFDDVILLAEGRIVYHGPRENILEFFESCGYKCPERKGEADFLQEVTSPKDQEQYWSKKTTPYKYTSVKEFAEAFRRFHVGRAMSQYIAEPYDRRLSHPAALAFDRYSVSTMELFKATYQRELLLMKRNAFVYVFKSFQIIMMALVAASVFFRTEMHRRNVQDAQIYAGALFFGVINIMFNGFAELALTILQLPVFFKHRDLLFYPPWTYSVSKFIQSIPISALESTLWICLTYYTIGYAPDVSRFFRQLLLYFCVHQMAGGLFRFVAGVCRSMITANAGGSVALLTVFILGGFLIPRTSIKPWWIWGYWLSPLSYAQNAIQVNEFLSPQWDTILPGQNQSIGLQYLDNSGLFAKGYWFWIPIAVLVGYTVLFNIGFTAAITYFNPVGGTTSTVESEEDGPSMTEARLPIRRGSSFNSEVELSSTAQQLEILRSLRNSSSALNQTTGANARRGEKDERDSSPIMGTKSLLSTETLHSPSLRKRFEKYRAAGGEDPGLESKRGMILPFKPLTISFYDVNYFVDLPAEMKQQGYEGDKLQLLQGITGAFRPGVLTALVGVSGAGKSTLMDVLAGRKTGGHITGDIRISGYPKRQETFARISGYCEQNDIHSPQLTIKESVIYSAWLRLSSEITKDVRSLFVDQVMELVELTTHRNALVGLPGVTGLSTEQRKRLTIAVELVANPSIIFMDEPTSGLDARAAAIVMRCVRNTVDTGRTVVCTIHQPSIDIFEAFDELLLMKRGGQVIYAGPLGRHSRQLVKYFESIPGVPPIMEGYNPATWMLEVSSIAVEHKLDVDFADIYEDSPLFERNKAMVKELSHPMPGTEDLWYSSQFSQPFFSQLKACLWKQNLTYWRSPDYNNVRFIFTIASAILFGTIFWRMGKNLQEASSLYSIMGAMFGAVLFIGVNNSSTVQPVVATERTVFYRERAAGMYSAIPYAIAQVLIEVPYSFAQTLIYATVTYALIGLKWTAAKFLWYVYFMFLTFLYFTFYGMMAVGITPNHQIASVVAAFFYGVFNLFSGFLIPRTRIPKWWIWYYWACPVAWTLYGVITSQFGDVDMVVIQKGVPDVTVKEFIKLTFGFEHDFLPIVAIVIFLFTILFATVFMFAIKFLNFQQR